MSRIVDISDAETDDGDYFYSVFRDWFDNQPVLNKFPQSLIVDSCRGAGLNRLETLNVVLELLKALPSDR